jgi:hypothetical protein
VLNKLRSHALRLKYVRELDFVSRFNMFEMFLPFQKEKLFDIIKEQYPNIKMLDNSKKVRQDLNTYNQCNQSLKL